jgi:pimeloyl-ACP methyl ester carboxylesterase
VPHCGMVDRRTQVLTTADGRRLCFAEWGLPDGLPVFALHGSPGCRLGVATETDAIVTELGGRLITYDRPGYGQSDRRGPETRVVDHVDDVRAIADRLRIDSFSITGFSGGAPHALAVAARLSDRVVRVSNTGAIAPLDLVGLDEWQRAQDGDTREYLTAVRASEAACTTLFRRLDAEARAALADDDPMRDAKLEPTRQGVAAWVNDERALEAPWGFHLSEIRAPTVIYANPNDTVTPPNHAEWLVAHIRSAVLVASANAPGHAAINDTLRARTAMYTWLISGGEPIAP